MARKSEAKKKKQLAHSLKQSKKKQARKQELSTRGPKRRPAPPQPPTPTSEEGMSAQQELDDALEHMDADTKELQKLLSQCKGMITELYNGVVKAEVRVNNAISTFTKNAMFAEDSAERIQFISKLNTEKNRLYYFKKNVVAKLVATYVQISRETDSVEMLNSLHNFSDDYSDAMTEMQEIMEEAAAVYEDIKEYIQEEPTTVEDVVDVEAIHEDLDNIDVLVARENNDTDEYTQGEMSEELRGALSHERLESEKLRDAILPTRTVGPKGCDYDRLDEQTAESESGSDITDV